MSGIFSTIKPEYTTGSSIGQTLKGLQQTTLAKKEKTTRMH